MIRFLIVSIVAIILLLVYVDRIATPLLHKYHTLTGKGGNVAEFIITWGPVVLVAMVILWAFKRAIEKPSVKRRGDEKV